MVADWVHILPLLLVKISLGELSFLRVRTLVGMRTAVIVAVQPVALHRLQYHHHVAHIPPQEVSLGP